MFQKNSQTPTEKDKHLAIFDCIICKSYIGWDSDVLHSGRLTWNPTMEVWKMIFLPIGWFLGSSRWFSDVLQFDTMALGYVTSRPISWKAIGAGLEDLELDDLERLESFVKLLPNVTMGNPGRVPYITFSYKWKFGRFSYKWKFGRGNLFGRFLH